MTSSVEQRASKNTFAGVVGFLVTFLQSIIIVPIILQYWGTEKYSNWIALMAGFALLQTLDSGHQNYIGNEINVLYHRSKAKLREVLGSSLRIAFLIGFIEVLLTLTLIFTGGLSIFLGLNTADFEIKYALLALIIMWFIFGSVGGIIIRILVPIGKLYQLQWIAIFVKLVQFFVLLIVVFLKCSILSAAITYAIVQSILTILSLLYIKKLAPEFYPWWHYGSFKTAFKNFTKSIVLTANIIIQQLSVNGLILFISNFYQLVMLPVFTTIRTLTNTAGSVTNIVISAINPDIVKYYSKGENRKLYLALTTNLFLSGMIVNISLVLSIFFIEPLYVLWTNGQLGFNKSLFLFLAAGIAFSNFGIGIVNYFSGTNKLKQYTLIVFARSLSLFVTAFLFIGKADLSTIGLSVAISELIASVILPIYLMNIDHKSFLQENRYKFILLSIVPPIMISCLAFITYFDYFSINFVYLALLIIVLIYYLNWKMIDLEVKERLYGIVNKYLKIKKS